MSSTFRNILLLLICIIVVATAKAEVHKVNMYMMKYRPALIVIKQGDSIQWINRDNAMHNVVFAYDPSKRSPLLRQQEAWTYTFEEAGGYDYYCGPHKATMRGLINVLPKEE